MSKTFVFGIIGSGMIAREHIKNLQTFANVRVKWVCGGSNENRLKKVQEEFNIPATTTNYINVLNDKEVDAVVICTPPFLHKKMFLDSLHRNKHILLEKPSAISMGDMEEMMKEAEKYPHLKICDCSCRHSRLQPKFPFVKKIIESGQLGDIYYIHHNENYLQGRPGIEYNPTAKWFLNKAEAGGGLILDWGVYDLSFHLGILNDKPELLEVDGMLAGKLDFKDPGAEVYDNEEHAIVNMKFSGGLNYYWERAYHSNVEVPNETRIYGTRAGLKFGFLSWNEPKVTLIKLDENSQAMEEVLDVPMENYPGDGYMLIEHFIQVLEGKEEPAMPLSLAAKHLDIIFKSYQNSRKITSFP